MSAAATQLGFARTIGDEAVGAEFERNRLARDRRSGAHKVWLQFFTSRGVEVVAFNLKGADNIAVPPERINNISRAMAEAGFAQINPEQITEHLSARLNDHFHYAEGAPAWPLEVLEAVVSDETGVPLGPNAPEAAANTRRGVAGGDAEPEAPAGTAVALSSDEAKILAARNVDWLLHTFKGTQHVAAIQPDTGQIRCFTFTKQTAPQAVAFLTKYAPTHGLYYQPNEVRADLGPHRANKTDFVRIRAAVADVDPDDDATKQPGGLLREQQRIRTEGEAREDDPRTRPSFVVASGRGEQVGYVLREPIPAHEHRDRFEILMRGILLALGTDTSTHDVGRLVRLPYGVNYPNARKRKQGHIKPVQTGLAFASEALWTLDELEAIYPPIAEAKTKIKGVREAKMLP